VDPAADRPQLDAEGGRDLLVGQALDVAQDHGDAELRRERVERGLDLRVQMGVGVDLLGAGRTARQPLGVLRQRVEPDPLPGRTMSRNRFVVIRCSQPSKVPGEKSASDRNTRTNVSWVRSSASCALPERR